MNSSRLGSGAVMPPFAPECSCMFRLGRPTPSAGNNPFLLQYGSSTTAPAPHRVEGPSLSLQKRRPLHLSTALNLPVWARRYRWR